MGKEMIATSIGKARDDASMWPMRASIVVDGVKLSLQASCPGGTNFTLTCNGNPWHTIKLTDEVGILADTTEAPELKGEVLVCTSKTTEKMDICVDRKFPMPWTKDNGRTMMSCVTTEADVGVINVKLIDLDCPKEVVHDLFELLAELKYPAGKGLSIFSMSGWKPQINELWDWQLNKMLPVC